MESNEVINLKSRDKKTVHESVSLLKSRNYKLIMRLSHVSIWKCHYAEVCGCHIHHVNYPVSQHRDVYDPICSSIKIASSFMH